VPAELALKVPADVERVVDRLLDAGYDAYVVGGAVRDAVASGRLKGHEKLPAKMVLTIGGVSLSHEITDEIELG